MSDPTSRVLQLLSLLQTYRFWPGNELSGRLGVSSRTLRRDIDRLRELGYPVDATPGVAGGYRLASGAHMPPLLLDDDEAVAIAVGLRAAAGASIEGIEETSLRALAKLEQVLPDRLRRRVSTLHSNVVSLRWGGDDAVFASESLAVLAQACRDHEEVRFDYRRRDGEEAARLVEPHQLVSAGRRWYLVGFDVRRDDWRTFRLDRMTDPRLAGVRFSPRGIPGGDAAAFVAEAFSRMESAHTVVLAVTGGPEEVQALFPGWDVDLVDLGDGRCRVELGDDDLRWLVVRAASVAVDADVEILEGSGPEVVEAIERAGARLSAASG
jgi:predicted DNA-binding transcriptional regulator YafY